MSITTRTRFMVLKRDGFRCVYCGRSSADVELHVDHIEAKSKGGPDEFGNFVTACAPCNLGKGTLSPIPDEIVSLPASEPVVVAASPSLAGKCFLVFGEKEEILSQGIVRAKVTDETYLIQFFDWLMGEPSTMQIVCLSTMVARPAAERSPNSWMFFEDPEHLSGWLETHDCMHQHDADGDE